MAIRVEYFKNTIDCYHEGPFVMVPAAGWRIEVDIGSHCPALPDSSIYGFLREQCFRDRTKYQRQPKHRVEL